MASGSKMPLPRTSCLLPLEALFFFSLLGFFFFFFKGTVDHILPWLSDVMCFWIVFHHFCLFGGPLSTHFTMSLNLWLLLLLHSKYFHDISCHLCFDDKPTFLILAFSSISSMCLPPVEHLHFIVPQSV